MASQAYDKALQLDKSNTTAKTKLNLIKDLFPSGRPAGTSGNKGEPPARIATAPAAISKPAPPQPAPTTPKASEPTVAVTKEPPVKAAPPKESPVAKAEASKEQAKSAANQNPDEVLKAVTGWAKAWSANDVDGYLAHYAADFQTPKGVQRSNWEAQRKARIAKPRKIEVAIESPKVTFSQVNRVTVTFRQHYQSGGLKATSTKTLVMVKSGEKWLIQQERVSS
jgi:ketosteroid isomerase-like protein